jgi:hypothetical protein
VTDFIRAEDAAYAAAVGEGVRRRMPCARCGKNSVRCNLRSFDAVPRFVPTGLNYDSSAVGSDPFLLIPNIAARSTIGVPSAFEGARP